MTRVLTLYEPRWHGLALWKLEQFDVQNEDAPADQRFALVRTLQQGWTRRPRGSECIHFVEGKPRV